MRGPLRTGEQTATFLRGTADHRLSALWVLLAHTGARRGEILGSSWDDVDLDAIELHIRRALAVVAHQAHLGDTKTADSVRTVALDARSVDVLRAHRKRQAAERLTLGAGWADTGLVFTTPTGEWLHPERVSRTFGELAARLRLPLIRVHDLRHGWATAALTAGLPLEVVSDRLGHRTTAITADVYSHVQPEVQGDAAERVAALFAGSSTGSRWQSVGTGRHGPGR